MSHWCLARKHFFVSFDFFFETGYCYEAQAGLKLLILLCQLPKCWNTGVNQHVWQYLLNE
jgi:hypothetical protein